jgi:hypothetical protein
MEVDGQQTAEISLPEAAPELPQSPPNLQIIATNHSIPSPPRPARKRGRTTNLQKRRRTKQAHLLKKASPALPQSPSLHLEDLTKSFTGNRPTPRESAMTTSFQ